MRLLLNELGSIRHESRQGGDYLVAPVTPMKAMNLDKGYVPEDEVRKSQKAWNGTPVTLNHPRNDHGDLVSANSPDIMEKTRVGTLFNVNSPDQGESLEGEVWIDTAKAKAIGGGAEQIVNMLEGGDNVSVSTSYFGDKLTPGRYDGEHRTKVIGNLRPDHLALLPNKKGRCSISDGCMAGELSANSLQVAATNKSAAGVSFEGTKDGKLVKEEIDKDEHTLSDHYLFGSGEDKGDYSYPVVDADNFLRKGNVKSAYKVGASGEGVSESELHSKLRKLNDEFDSPPIDEDKLSGNTDDPGNSGEDSSGQEEGQSGSVLRQAFSSLVSSITENRGAAKRPRDGGGRFIEKDADLDSLRDGDVIKVTKNSGNTTEAVHLSSEGSHVAIESEGGESRRIAADSVERVDVVQRFTENSMTERDTQIEYLVENHDYEKDMLEGASDACLRHTYNELNEDDDGGKQAGNSEDDGSEVLEVMNELREEVSEIKEEAVMSNEASDLLKEAQEAQEKQDLKTEIVANSEKYDEESLEDASKELLENIRGDVMTQSTNYAGQIGGSSGTSDDENLSGWENRASKRMEGDD